MLSQTAGKACKTTS